MEHDKHTEKELKTLATSCHGCKDWWHICHADCCKVFRLKFHRKPIPRFGKYKFDKRKLSKDLVWYFKIHGATFTREHVVLNVADYDDIIWNGRFLMFYRSCDLLEGTKCKGHPDNKPEVCKGFDEKQAVDTDKWFVVPRCLARYKQNE